MCASGARVFCSSFDKSTGRTYWLQGHYSDRDILTLHYWSRPEKGVCSLTGVVLLKVEYNFQEANLHAKGWWRAYTRENTITSGETHWKRLG